MDRITVIAIGGDDKRKRETREAVERELARRGFTDDDEKGART